MSLHALGNRGSAIFACVLNRYDFSWQILNHHVISSMQCEVLTSIPVWHSMPGFSLYQHQRLTRNWLKYPPVSTPSEIKKSAYFGSCELGYRIECIFPGHIASVRSVDAGNGLFACFTGSISQHWMVIAGTGTSCPTSQWVLATDPGRSYSFYHWELPTAFCSHL